MGENLSPDPLVSELRVEDRGKAVIAGRVENLNLYTQAGSVFSSIDPFATVPPLPPNFISRPEITEPIIESLSNSDTVALTAIEGMGGIGKTVIANEICQDPRVRKAFPDGILWFAIGNQSGVTPEDLTRKMAEHLNLEFKVYSQAVYRSMFKGKSVLVVLDDVWSLEFIESFRIDLGRSRLLYTTRIREIAPSLGAKNHDVGLLDNVQARHFLARWSGSEFLRLFEPQATEILGECNGLVLGLAMIGAALKNKPASDWARIVRNLRNSRLKDSGVPVANYAYRTLWASIAASIEELSRQDKDRYFGLAILLEDMSAPAALLQHIWGGDVDDVEPAMNRLVDLSLASRDASGGIRLHDLQLDYVRAQFSDREALDLIHGAMRLSAHVVSRDPDQFASQMVGRLLLYHHLATIDEFVDRIAEAASKPWLRPLLATLHPPGTSLVRTLQGHTGVVVGVALSGDGRRAVSASADQTLKVWDVETGRALRTLPGHTDLVTGVALTGDGRCAVSASWDRTLKVWDVETGRELHALQGHTSWVTSVALSGDGRRAVSASADQTLKVWDLETGRELCALQGHTGDVFGVALSGDGRRAVSASRDKLLKVWDVETGRELRSLQGHAGDVLGVALSRDGLRAVSASRDKTLKVWDVETGRELRTLEGHTGSVLGVALSGDGLHAASASRDHTLKVWNAETGRELCTLRGHTNWVYSAALSRDGLRAVSASRDHTLKVWLVEARRELQTLQSHMNWVDCVALSRDRRVAISASYDQTLKVWDVETGLELRTIQGHTGYVHGVALSADGRLAISASSDRTLRMWDVVSGRERRTLRGHSKRVTGVELTGDGRRAISASRDHTVKVWDVEAGYELHTLQGHTGWVNDVALSVDGQCAVSASQDHTLKVWNVETGRERCTLRGHTNWVNGVALSGDGRIAVSASSDRMLKVWDVETGRELSTLHGHTSYVHDVALSGDGRIAVSASSDHTLKVWNLEKEKAIATFACDGAVYSCALINHDRFIAGDTGGRVHFLRLEEPE